MPVPGVTAEVINLILQCKDVVLVGEPRKADDESIMSYLKRVFSDDSFERTIALPDGVDGTKITAELMDGFLELSTPMFSRKRSRSRMAHQRTTLKRIGDKPPGESDTAS